jgi:uracil-DNA glycosylase
MTAGTSELRRIVADIRACRICAADIEPRPILRASATAKLCLVGQAPGSRVHLSGVPWTDPSGDRLRDWLGLDRDTFYDERLIAIVPMGFCFPGLDAKGGDRPPRRECARIWREALFAALPEFKLTILIGGYAQKWHLGARNGESLTQTVKAWRNYAPRYIPLPHPSWRNNAWLKKNPWFDRDLLPYLRGRVRRSLYS